MTARSDTVRSNILNYAIASVWLVNGLGCKVLNWVPRHQQIVAKILGEEHARLLTILIGVAEIGMALWVLSKRHTKWNAIVQISVVAAMNVLECALAPELLLWGRLNAFFANCFIALVYYNAFARHRSIRDVNNMNT